MDCIVLGVAKSRTWLSDFHFPYLHLAETVAKVWNSHQRELNRKLTKDKFPEGRSFAVWWNSTWSIHFISFLGQVLLQILEWIWSEEYCRHRMHPKQKHRPPILDWHDWRHGERFRLAGVITFQDRCCLASSNHTKGSLRQILRFLHKCLGPGLPNGNSSDTKIAQSRIESYSFGCQDYPSESPEICLLLVRPSSLPISYSATNLILLLGILFSDFQDLLPFWKLQSASHCWCGTQELQEEKTVPGQVRARNPTTLLEDP